MTKRSIIITALLTTAAMAQQLQVDRDLHDFGKVREDQLLTAEFTISNSGGKELVIAEVKASCGCTAGNLDKKRLAPGESTLLTVSFDPKDRGGTQRKYVTITSNDVKHQTAKVNIQAQIVPLYDLDPSQLEFVCRSGHYEVAEKTFTLSFGDTYDGELQITGAGTNNDNVSVVGPDDALLKQNESRTFTVRIDPAYDPGKQLYHSVFVFTRYGDRTANRGVPVLIRYVKAE